MKSLDRTNSTMNHPLTANCLRKCAYWSLSSQIKLTKESMTIQKNSGIAVRQMNYQVFNGLSKEQLQAKKESLKIPC